MARAITEAPKTIEGYDLQAEKGRYRFPDVAGMGRTLNRGTARIEVKGPVLQDHQRAARSRHQEHIFTTTHDKSSPVLEIGYPAAGPFHASSTGVYFDAMLGVAQKILDANHPSLVAMVDRTVRSGLALRREINTDDYFACAPGLDGVPMPQDLAALVTGLAAHEFARSDGFRVFFSNSGAEAVEAGIKLASVVRWRQLEERYGPDTLRRLQKDLEIGPHRTMNASDPVNKEEIWADYPMFFVAFQRAFHGRTLGALALTNSKRVHHPGYWKPRWVHHLPYNCDPAALEAIVDERDIPAILAAPGGVRDVVAKGRIPKDLLAALVAEPMQGEGGYRPGEAEKFQGYLRLLRRWGALLMLDEVQTFGRTGRLFCGSYFVDDPDIVCIAKGAVVGITIGRKSFERYLHPGWHSNTWGGGKVFDTAFSFATLDALAHYRDPVLSGLSYADNCRVKGAYLAWHLDRIAEAHPGIVTGHSGLGLMRGVSVHHRDELVDLGWQRGLHLLGCGLPGEEARLRLVFLADTLTREIDEFARVFDAVCAEIEASKGKSAGAHPPTAVRTP